MTYYGFIGKLSGSKWTATCKPEEGDEIVVEGDSISEMEMTLYKKVKELAGGMPFTHFLSPINPKTFLHSFTVGAVAAAGGGGGGGGGAAGGGGGAAAAAEPEPEPEEEEEEEMEFDLFD